eukprot:1328507-Pleurochrysis_carterae.AAC.2
MKARLGRRRKGGGGRKRKEDVGKHETQCLAENESRESVPYKGGRRGKTGRRQGGAVGLDEGRDTRVVLLSRHGSL